LNLQRFKDDTLRFYSSTVLFNIDKDIRRIDWEPAVMSIEYLLIGDNLFLLQRIISIL